MLIATSTLPVADTRNTSVVCNTCLLSAKGLSDDPAGIGTLCAIDTLAFVSVSDVSDCTITDAVMPEVVLFVIVPPIHIVVVLLGTV